MSGVFGSWFDHVLEYWKLSDQENVLFLKYEDIKKVTGFFLLKVKWNQNRHIKLF